MTEANAPETSASPAAPAPRKRRRWRRILLIACLVVVALSVAMRVTISLAFPSVLRNVAAAYDLDAAYERMELYAFGGDVGLSHLTLTPKAGGEPILDLEYCRADVSALNLLRGKLVVRRVEADEVAMHVEREPDGSIPLLQKLLAGGPTEPTTQPTQFTVEPPLRIDALRLSRIRAKWRDRSVQPPVESEVEMTLRVSDVGSPTRPTRFLLDMTAPPLLDTLRIEGEGTSRGQALDANVLVLVRGMHPKPAAGYLLPLGFRPVADNISMGCTATIKTRAIGPASTTRPADLAGDVVVENMVLVADGREAAGVNRVTAKVDAANGSMARLASVLIEGVRAAAERTAAGDVRVAGFELVPVATPPDSAAAAAPVPEATQPAGQPLRLEVADLTIRNARATFADASVTPAANLAFIVNELSARDLITEPDAVVTIAGDFAAPGMAKAIRLTGTAKPFAPVQTVDAKVVVNGIHPEAVRGYLDAAGMESTMNDAAATCDLTASLASGPDGRMLASVVARKISLSDGTELFAFDNARVNGASVDPRDGRIRVELVELSGPRLNVERGADGTVRALGFRTRPATIEPAINKPASEASVAGATAAPTTAPAATALVPKLEIGRLTWKGVAIGLNDLAVNPPTSMTIADAGIEMSDVRVGVAPEGADAPPGRIRAWITAPGLAKGISVTGTVSPLADGATAVLDVTGTGLDAQLLAPYLKAAGIEPTLKDGSLTLGARATLAGPAGEPVRASLSIEKLRYAEGRDELIGVDGVHVDGVELRDDRVAVAAVRVDRPRARVERDVDGAIHLAGVRIPPPSSQPADPDADSAAPVVAPTTRPASQLAPQPAPLVAMLDTLRVAGASLTWVDRTVQPEVTAVGRADVELDKFVFGQPADPAKVKITAKVDQTLEQFVASGLVVPDPDSPRVQLDLVGAGIRGGVLAPYLPPGTQISLNDGRFAAKLDASAAPNPKGGRSASLDITSFDYREGGAEQPLVRFDDAKVSVSRADAPGGVIAVEEVSLHGLEAEVHKAPDGSTRFLGLTISQPPAQPQAVPAADAQPAATPPPPAAPPTTGSTDAKALIARQAQKSPLVTLDKLDVQLKRVAYVDRSKPGAAALALSDVRLRNPKRIELLGEDAASRPPVELELVGGIDPVVRRFNVAIQSSPFATPATLQVKIAADGIRGDGVTDVLPELREQIDGTGLADGRFAATLDAQAKFERRGPAELDLGRPFEGSVSLRGVAFRAAPDSPVLAGVEEVRAEPIRVDSRSGSVTIRTLEIIKPIGRAHRDADGLRVLGLLVRETPAATQPSSPPEESTPAPSKPDATLAAHATAEPAPKPSSEFRIDKLIVSGIDLLVEDRSVDPPLIVPVNSLEAEVRDLSNLALFEDRPIRFNVTASAGKVPLKDEKERELFSEVAAAGKLSLHPAVHGWARSSVSGFEMQALRGVADAQGVNIENGVFDSSVDVRIGEDGVLNTRSRFAFTDLRMSEPSNGPIQRVLKLPGPLDTVIIVLQDPSGAITVPLNVKVEEGTVSGGQIAGAAVTALGSIVATAMASAPLKVTGGVTQLVGLDKAIPMLGGKKEKAPSPAGEVTFAPGDVEATDARDLDRVARRMLDDKAVEVTLRHEIGGDDVALAAARANPPPEQCLAMAQQLRQRKFELIEARARLAAEARAVLLSHSVAAAASTARLRGVDRDLAATEQALDRLYDLVRPGAERQAERRTRAACIELADERIATIRQRLTASGIEGVENRVNVIRSPSPAAEGQAPGRVLLTTTFKKKV